MSAINEIIADERRKERYSKRAKLPESFLCGLNYKDNSPDYEREEILEQYRESLYDETIGGRLHD